MSDNLHHSTFSGNRSSQNMPQGIAEAYTLTTAEVADSPDRQPDLTLDIQSLQILDSSDDSIKVLDLDGRVLFISRGGQTLLGIQDIKPFLNTPWAEFWQEGDRQAAMDAITKARTGEVCSFQGYRPTPSGEPRWWECKVSPMRGVDGQIKRLLCISRDISERKQIEDERKQAEEKLRESEERYRAIVNQAVTGVACTDLNGNLTLVNQKYCDITGYSADELIQLRMQDITHPEDLPRNVELFHRMRAEGTPFEIEKRYIRKDGSIVWVNNSVSVIRDRDGKPQSAVAIVLDITERKQAALSAEFFAMVTQDLAEATSVEDMIQTVGEQLNQYLQISICAFVEINESKEVAAIHHSWHQKEVPSLVGAYHLAEFVTDEFFQMAKAGRPIIVRDVTTDSRIADPERFAHLKIGSFINVPLIRDNEWKFTLGIYHQTPYNWRSDEIELMCELANRIWTKLERTRVEIALRQSQEMFSALVADAPFGVYMIDSEFRFRQANQTAIAAFNVGPLIGQDLAEVLRIIWQEPFATEAIDHLRHTLATGEPYYSLPMAKPRADIAEIQSYDWRIHRITLPDGSYGVVCYFYDLSEIKRAEAIMRRNADRDAFLVSLNDALRPLTNAAEIQVTAARILGGFLGATRVIYIEVAADGEEVIVHRNYVNGVKELSGRYRLEEYRRNLIADHQAGRTQVVIDIPGNPKYTETEKARYHEIDIAAHIDVPLIKNNQFVALLAAQQSTPRQWTEIEVNLVEETAERTWAAVERAHAEADLRESEAKYRGLFKSLDEGYFLADVIFDENDRPIDIFYLEANPAATRMVGQDFTGRRLREIDPNYEAYWYEIFGRVAQTGVGERLEQYAEPNQKWYDFYVFKVGDENSHRVSVVFKDITERKRREAHAAFLAEIGEDFSRLSTANEIMQTVGAKIGAYLQITTCNFADVDEDCDQVTTHHGWSSPEVPSNMGTFRLSQYLSQEFERASRAGETVVICNTQTDPRTDAAGYAALNMYSFVTVPFHRHGRWTHYIAICHSQPRNWREDEIQLIEEISNRIFPRLQRARTEEALRESEAKYRSLFTSIDEGFNLLEMIPDESGHPADFRIVETNPAWEQQTGLTDAVGKTLLEIAPNFEQQWLDFYGDAVISGGGRRTEYYTASVDRWYTVHASRIGGEGSRQVAVLFNDITKRKRAEEQLRDSAERQQFLLNFSDSLRVLPDKETIERTSLQLLAEYLRLDRVYIAAVYSGDDRAVIGPEYRRPDLMPMVGELHLSDFPEAFRIVEEQTLVIDNIADHPTLSDRDRQSLAAINLTALVVASARRGERNVIWSVLAAMTTPRSWTAGEVALIETVAERTWAMVERANAEAALRKSEARYRSLFESMDEAYAVVEVLADDNGKWNDFLFLEVNPAFVKQTGMEYPVRRKATELLGTPNPRWAEVYGQVVETGEPIRFEESEATLGRVFDLYVFRLGGDGSRRVAVLFTNITERKQAEAQRKQLLEREQAAREVAEQANRIKDEFLAVLSHELRSPLNPILGWSTLLLNGKLDTAKTTQAFTIIQRNAKLQSELIEDLLDVSRILQGKLNLNVAPVNLAISIQGAMETVRLAAEAKSIQIKASLAEGVGLVLGDATRLQQIVWNLLSNAVKFTPPGGQVNVRLERVDSSAQITVSDTGQGITPGFLPYVFDYFRQADGATTRKFGGLGLGLAIVRHLVELHGGTVRADSFGEGQGATFTIRLPLLHTSSLANQDDQSSQQSLNLNGINILVVDDEPDTRDLVAFVLEQQGAQVITVTSAYEALLMLPQAKPDVLLSDIGMPEMDGYMLIQQVRALAPDQGGQIPAIALTAYAGDTNQQQVLATGFQKHISKPIEPEVLVQTIVHLIHRN